MDAKARRALRTIRQCLAARRYRMTPHFTQRLDERGIYWSDVLAVLDEPAEVREGGPEEQGRPKWIVAGASAAGDDLELVCVLDTDERGTVALLITIYEVFP